MQITRGDNKTFNIERYNAEDTLITDKAEELILTCKANSYTKDIIFQKKLSNNDFKFENGTIIDIENREIDISNLNYDKILELKKNLSDTDYKAIKYAEGFITEEDYAPIKAQRQA